MDPLIRHLAGTYGLALARRYHRLPLFLLPEDSAPLVEAEAELLEALPADGLRLPFEDLLLDFPAGATAPLQRAVPGWPDRGRLWVRVRRVEAALAGGEPLLIAPAHLASVEAARWALLEGWEARTSTGGFAPLPDCSLLPLDTRAGDFAAVLHAYPNPEHLDGRLAGIWCNLARCTLAAEDGRRARCVGSELIQATTARLVLLALIYLAEGLGTILEMSPAAPPTAREENTADLKPWLAPRQRTWIVVDPGRLADYGHPSAVAPGAGRQRRSPAPHARRGHWRRLPPRWRQARTWVRPTWVGPEEWVAHGSRYRVVFR